MKYGDIIEATKSNIWQAGNVVGDRFKLVKECENRTNNWFVTDIDGWEYPKRMSELSHEIWDDSLGKYVYCFIFPLDSIKLLKPKRKEELLNY